MDFRRRSKSDYENKVRSGKCESRVNFTRALAKRQANGTRASFNGYELENNLPFKLKGKRLETISRAGLDTQVEIKARRTWFKEN